MIIQAVYLGELLTYFLCEESEQSSHQKHAFKLKSVRNVSLTQGEVINETTSALPGKMISLNSLAQVVMDNHIALDFFVGQSWWLLCHCNISCT